MSPAVRSKHLCYQAEVLSAQGAAEDYRRGGCSGPFYTDALARFEYAMAMHSVSLLQVASFASSVPVCTQTQLLFLLVYQGFGSVWVSCGNAHQISLTACAPHCACANDMFKSQGFRFQH